MKTQHGFSLIEALIATAVLTTGVGTLAQLVLVAAKSIERARTISSASIAAQEKLEQLRALASVSDGGEFAMSPAGALDENTAGFCDFLDRYGQPLEGDTTAPPNTVFVRRWSAEPIATEPDVILVQVRVSRFGIDAVRLVGTVHVPNDLQASESQ